MTPEPKYERAIQKVHRSTPENDPDYIGQSNPIGRSNPIQKLHCAYLTFRMSSVISIVLCFCFPDPRRNPSLLWKSEAQTTHNRHKPRAYVVWDSIIGDREGSIAASIRKKREKLRMASPQKEQQMEFERLQKIGLGTRLKKPIQKMRFEVLL